MLGLGERRPADLPLYGGVACVARAHSAHVARRVAAPADCLAEGTELRFDILVAHLVRVCGCVWVYVGVCEGVRVGEGV